MKTRYLIGASMETTYKLRKWASEMAMGSNLSADQGPLLAAAAAEIERLRGMLQDIWRHTAALDHLPAELVDRMEFWKDGEPYPDEQSAPSQCPDCGQEPAGCLHPTCPPPRDG